MMNRGVATHVAAKQFLSAETRTGHTCNKGSNDINISFFYLSVCTGMHSFVVEVAETFSA